MYPDPGTPRRRGRRFPVVSVSCDLIDGLTVDGLATYLHVARWSLAGEPVNRNRVAALLDDARADAVVAELTAAGLLITPEADAAEREERAAFIAAEEARSAAEKAEARRVATTPPNPWPDYLPGGWGGSRAVAPEHTPDGPAVYFLYDADDTLIYVGSTGDVLSRLGAHWDKPWTRWEARRCIDRDIAYWQEAAEIVWGRPTLNRDRHLYGRAARVPKRRPRGGRR